MVAVLVFIVASVLFMWMKKRRDDSVATAQIRRGASIEAVYGIGTVMAFRLLEVKSGVAAGVVDRYVEEGDHVNRGDPLLRLTESGLVRAPFSGVVSSLGYNVGESVFQGDILLSLVDRSQMYLLVSFDQRAAIRVLPGLQAEISFDGLREQTFAGRVRSIFPQNNRFVAHIDVPGGFPEQILLGMAADVGIVLNRKENVLLAPIEAIHDGKIVVFRDGRRTTVAVQAGHVNEGWVEILSDEIKEGESVLLKEP